MAPPKWSDSNHKAQGHPRINILGLNIMGRGLLSSVERAQIRTSHCFGSLDFAVATRRPRTNLRASLPTDHPGTDPNVKVLFGLVFPQ